MRIWRWTRSAKTRYCKCTRVCVGLLTARPRQDKLLADLNALRPKLEDQAQKNADEMEQAVARFRVLNRELPEKTNSARGAANSSATAAVKNCAVCKAKLTGKAVEFEERSYHKVHALCA